MTRVGCGSEHLLVAGILLLALILRTVGVNFGLPYEYHVDEVQYVRQAASMGAEGLEPVWWNNPPFYKYILLGEYGVLFVVGRLLGWYASAADFGEQNSFDPTLLYLIARTTTALFGTATVLLVYFIGKLAYGRPTGLVTAVFLAVTFLHVRDSHFAVNDIALTFFTTLAVLASVGIAQSGKWRWYILAGLALGLGFATKYSAVLGLAPVIVAHLFARYTPKGTATPATWRQLAGAIGIAAIAAIVASPYFVIVPGRVIRDVYEALYLAGQQGFDRWQIDADGGYLFYLKTLRWGLGWPLALVILLGLIFAAVRHSRQDTVLMTLPILLFLTAGRQEMYFARFILPMIPPLLVLAAHLVDILASGLLGNGSRWLPAAYALAILAISLPSLLASVRFDYLLAQNDTRTAASRWIDENLPDGAKIAVDWPFHAPPIATTARSLPNLSRVFEVYEAGQTGLATHPIEWYRQQGFDYLIASSFIYGLSLADPVPNRAHKAFYTSLGEDLTEVEVVKPTDEGSETDFIFDEIYGPAISLWQRERPGPVIRIYQIAQ